MFAYQRRAAWSWAVVLSCAIGATATAAEFNGPTSSVELPSFRPDEITTPVVVAENVGSDPAAIKPMLLNPDAPMKGTLETYEIVPDDAGNGWRIEAVTKTKTRKPVAALTCDAGNLKFQWQAGVTRADGGPLRNSVLGVIAPGGEQAVALRVPMKQPSLVLDFTKEIVRVPLIDDLPDENHLLLNVAGITGVDVSGELSTDAGKLKEPVFVGIKRTDADVPGARMRLVLWKTSLKPEVIVRPELVPVIAGAGGAAAGATAQPFSLGGGTTTAPVRTPATRPVVNADGADPTKPNPVNLPYTIRSLASAKTTLSGQLTAAQRQITLDQQGIFVRQNELAKYQGTITGTPEEIDLILAKIDRLEREVRALSAEVTQLEQVVVPNLNKQLSAFAPLEKLGNALHQKAKLDFRVYYTVAGKPIDVLVVGGDGEGK